MDGANTLQPSVLIVEDEPALVELLSYNLEKAGFRTAVARDGEEAMLAVAEAIPDLVLPSTGCLRHRDLPAPAK